LFSSLSELYSCSWKQFLSFEIKNYCSKSLLLVFKSCNSFLKSTISFLILLISCCKSEIVTTLEFCLENLSKVSSSKILDFEGLLTSSIIVFLSFLRYYSFNSRFSIFEIRVINKSSCSSALVKT
jgi:hypothetical protein